jgi:hypothetical protein
MGQQLGKSGLTFGGNGNNTGEEGEWGAVFADTGYSFGIQYTKKGLT